MRAFLGIAACRWWATLARAALWAAALWLAGCERGPGPAAGSGFSGIDITGASYASRLELPDTDGKIRALGEFRGKVVIVFFGYTQCPDICPGTLSEIAALRKSLGSDGERVQPVFVTVDPQRDTPEILRAYAQAFGDDVLALVGNEAQIRAAAQEFKVFYAKAPGKTAQSYTIDHTAGSYVFDPHGQVRLFWRHGLSLDAMRADIIRLLRP